MGDRGEPGNLGSLSSTEPCNSANQSMHLAKSSVENCEHNDEMMTAGYHSLHDPTTLLLYRNHISMGLFSI